MKKDVIYIDIEDDITAVIDKLKSSGEKIIAFVPPKGNTVLQSTVNLKLLKRAAESNGKQPVIVTNNNALTALAGGHGLYVAKNLQSKPYIPTKDEVMEADEDEAVEVTAAVGALAGAATAKALDDEMEVNGEDLAADLEEDDHTPAKEPSKSDKKAKKSKGKDSKKVPNFNSFKKKLLLVGAVAFVALIGLLFMFGRSKANIAIRAETTPVEIAYEAQLNGDASASNSQSFTIKPVIQEEKKTVSQSFTPTGKKDVGEKAKGTVTFSTGQISALGTTIPAGTRLRASSGATFATNSSVTMTLSNYSGASTGVTAVESGTDSNGASGSVSGAPSGINASLSGSTSGGTDKTVTVVASADVAKARVELEKKVDDSIKNELSEAFDDDVKVLEDSFTSEVGTVTSEPAVGQEANEGKLTAQVTYRMFGIKTEDLKAANEAFITKEMDNRDQQQVYKDGLEDVQLEKVKISGNTAVYKVSANGQFGPKFDTEALKQQISGKKVGEIRSYIESLPGVKGVDISLKPFWSKSAPAAEKIQIKLEVDENVAG